MKVLTLQHELCFSMPRDDCERPSLFFKSAETVHLMLLFYLYDAIRCSVSADLKMIAPNRPLGLSTYIRINKAK